MPRFIWLEGADGASVPVNPDQVAYIKAHKGTGEFADLVFGAVSGGLHMLTVQGDSRALVAKLEQAPEIAAPTARPARTKSTG